jgi:hypothetical protein
MHLCCESRNSHPQPDIPIVILLKSFATNGGKLEVNKKTVEKFFPRRSESGNDYEVISEHFSTSRFTLGKRV